jgi:hypothetical protein
MATAVQKRIETYLDMLRSRLRSLGKEEINDIIEELRSHILETSTVNGELAAREVDAALEALGNPEELASEYMTDAALARKEVSRSPLRILAALFRWGSLSVASFFVLVTDENLDNSASGKLMQNVLGSFHQFFSDSLSEKTKVRMQAGVKAGRWMWKNPLGYLLVKKQLRRWGWVITRSATFLPQNGEIILRFPCARPENIRDFGSGSI